MKSIFGVGIISSSGIRLFIDLYVQYKYVLWFGSKTFKQKCPKIDKIKIPSSANTQLLHRAAQCTYTANRHRWLTAHIKASAESQLPSPDRLLAMPCYIAFAILSLSCESLSLSPQLQCKNPRCFCRDEAGSAIYLYICTFAVLSLGEKDELRLRGQL